MDPLVKLRALRRAHYACLAQLPGGMRCLAPARYTVAHKGQVEARCAEHAEGAR